MKIMFLIFAIVISFSLEAQNYVITYQKSIKTGQNKPSLQKNESKNTSFMEFEKLLKNTSANYSLLINKEVSQFTVEQKMDSDSESPIERLSKTLFTKGEFYIKKQNKEGYNIKESFGEIFNIKLNEKKWTILKDTLSIGSFKCYKAITIDVVRRPDSKFEIETVAWFCPELPSYFGPVGYFGLPGLILKVDSKNFSLTATNIEKKDELQSIRIPKKGIAVTEEEFFEISMDASKAYGNRKN